MSKNTQFAAIKWIKNELLLSIKQARVLLEGIQTSFNNESLEKLQSIVNTLSNNLELANDDVGSILCKELSEVAYFIRMECASESADSSVHDLMQGLVLLNDHVENISDGHRVDSREIGLIIDVFRKRQEKPRIQKSLLYVLDLSNVKASMESKEENEPLSVLARESRPEFQRCLLAWFQDNDRKSALQKMVDITESVNSAATIELVQLYFSATSIVLDGVKDRIFGDDKGIKTLIGQVDKQLKLLATMGERRVAMGLQLGLVRQTLYYVARMPSDNKPAELLQTQLDLKANLASQDDNDGSIHTVQALASIAGAVRDEFKNIKHWLEDIVDNDKPPADEIDSFIQGAEGWAETLSVVGEQDLSENIADFVRRLAFSVYGATEPDEEQHIALAEDWLKIDEVLVAIQAKSNIESAAAENEELAEEDISVNVSTAKTMLSDLNIIKEIITDDLDGEISNTVRWPEINQLLNNVQAACHFIEIDTAAEYINDCRGFISAVIKKQEYHVNSREVSSIADIVSSVEYLLEDVANDTSVANVAMLLAKDAAAFLTSRVEDVHAYSGVEEVLEASPQETETETETETKAGLDDELSDDDLEILEIFMEEVGEISVELRDDFNKWKLDLNNEDVLKDVRRAFHTLKGSGRLAKVEFLSELSWSIEKVLNHVIEDNLEVNQEMVGLIGYFVDSLPEWADKINGERPELSDMNNLVLAAESIEKGEQPVVSYVTDEMRHNEGNEVKEEGELSGDVLEPELCEIFSNETTVHLATIQTFLDEHENQETVTVNESLFRALHTIHGCASMSHIAEVEQLSGGMCGYISELYENNLNIEVVDFYSVLKKYHAMTTQQVVALNVQDEEMPNHQALFERITQKHNELIEQVSQPIVQDIDESNTTVELTTNDVDVDKINNEEPEQQERKDTTQVNTEKVIEAKTDDIEMTAAELLPFVASDDVPANESKSSFQSTDNSDDQEMQAVFVEEGIELLEEISGLFKGWINDIDNKAAYLDKVLHILHTLKGSSLLVGFDDFGGVAHEIETLIEGYQERNETFTEPMLSRLLSISDDLHVGLSSEQLGTNPISYDALIESLKQPNETESLGVEKAEVVDVEKAEVVDVEKAEVVDVEKVPLKEKKVKSTVKAKEQTVKISNSLLDRLITDVGEVNVLQGQLVKKNNQRVNQIKELTLTIERLRKQLRKLEIETEVQVLFKVDKKAAEETEFDPLEMDHYSQIQQLSRSLLESISDLEEIRDSLLQSDDEISVLMQKEGGLTDTLLEDLLKTRMVDFSRYIPRFDRLVRQLATSLKKPVQLQVQGAETEIDRFILNELQTPIEHIIRNAMAHGVEPADVRKASNKLPEASITLNLSREGSEIHLTISDDGPGIDVLKVKEKALKLGHIKEHETMSEQDLFQFILKPGFSTLDEASTIAGRGIGMDIVNDTVRSIGGALTINSVKGEGSSFHLIFPYTMAINMALMVKTHGVQYGIPNNFIQSVISVPRETVIERFNDNQPELTHLGKKYQLHDLSQLLGQGSGAFRSSVSRTVHMLLMGSREEKHAVVIDQLVGNKEVVVKPLGLHLDMISWLSGATVSDEGDIVMMLDLPVLASLGAPAQDVNKPVDVEEDKPTAPLVMVVDDSITFRKVATRLLKRQGYDVVDARDGLDAVEKLTNMTPDLFLLDVEMPRMDGFELARHIRHTEGINNCPIVMVTSRTGIKHQNYAKEIGANGYFGKPFDNKVLVGSIKNLLEASYANE